MILRKILASSAVVVAGVMLMTSLAFAQKYMSIKDSVNVRFEASTNGTILGQVNANEVLEVVGECEGWKKVQYGPKLGWISSQFLKVVGESTKRPVEVNTTAKGSLGVITTIKSAVNVRSGAGTNYAVKVCLDKGATMTHISTNGSWYNIKTQSGIMGWVHSDFVSLNGQAATKVVTTQRNTTSTSRSNEVLANPNMDERSKIIAYARRFAGKRYVYGGSSEKGFDCSGFTKYVFANSGNISIERVAADQAREGKAVAKGNLIPGDLVFFDTDGGHNYINHVGIYIGNGDFIHASSGYGSVTYSDLNVGYYASAYMTARRVID